MAKLYTPSQKGEIRFGIMKGIRGNEREIETLKERKLVFLLSEYMEMSQFRTKEKNMPV